MLLAKLFSDKRILERIEAEIARNINEQKGIVGSFQDKDVRYKPRKPDEPHLEVIMTVPKSIMGLSEELLV